MAGILLAATARADPPVRFSEVVKVPGDDLTMLAGQPLDHLTLLSCGQAACRPVPFQIDQRDANGDWVLDQGPEPNSGQASGVLERGDLLLFMAADAGDRAKPADLPERRPGAEISLYDPLSQTTRWAYLIAYADAAPRSQIAYVQYDPEHDRVRGQHVTLGFHNGVPDYLALTDRAGQNVLDRLKVRASATFLWGLIRFARDEGDLSTQFVAWRQGPIRVIRRQRQWVRIGWGIRSPTFGSYTYFYRDFAELPVSLRLNFPPQYFFGNIVVRVILDFRSLLGWSVLTPSLPAPIPIDGMMTPQKQALNTLSDSWFAVRGPEITLVQSMDVSASLASVSRHVLYGESTKPDPPEAVPGQEPGIGFRLDRWDHVGAGLHQLQAISYALPSGIDVRGFIAARNTPVQVRVQPLP